MSAREVLRRVLFVGAKELAMALAEPRPAGPAEPPSSPSSPEGAWRVEMSQDGQRLDLGEVRASSPQSAAERAIARHVDGLVAATEKIPPRRWAVLVTPAAGGEPKGIEVSAQVIIKVEAVS